jgi:hypothetical protein
MTNRHLYITLLAILGFGNEALAQILQPAGAPRLVVSIAIDQLSSDNLESFAHLYSDGGLKRLLGEGMVFTNASYPFSPVDRASAIAAVATGTTPYYNGVVGREWLDRETLRPAGCVDDAHFTGLLTEETASPAKMVTSTVCDELKMATSGKAMVYAIAPYRDAAVISAGHAADAALWLNANSGEWCSSVYYLKKIPNWLKAYNEQHSPGKKNGGKLESDFTVSPQVNAEVTQLALQCIASNGLGNDNVTDMLCLTYYAGSEKAGKERASEIQKGYVQIDTELNQLLTYTDQAVGRDNVLYIITSTGHSYIGENDYTAYRIPTGTFYINRTAGLLNMYLGAIWGQGNYVEATFHNQIFLNHKLLDTRHVSLAEATAKSREIISMMAGVRHVHTSLQMVNDNGTHTMKLRNAFNLQRCGDIVIEVAPGWRILNEDTQQSEMSVASYTQFPIIFYGAGTDKGRVEIPVSTDRIAPTLSKAIRIRAPNACSSEPLF